MFRMFGFLLSAVFRLMYFAVFAVGLVTVFKTGPAALSSTNFTQAFHNVDRQIQPLVKEYYRLTRTPQPKNVSKLSIPAALLAYAK